ncbi:unnamed protein product [Cyclocybe aegerita]|uniref:Thioredoxin domain-containing protein n=1 Tax=Cyclocybe aegerita TaxID=1973307 RepID=A0A8S0XWB9_CYCAE|nr:unnamed protein product [Cyclocybe aegerita]
MAVVSSSTSFPDLRAPPGYRIKRKPPPTIDISERYPTPDPQDPFAPLWVLRNRTGSSFGPSAYPYARHAPYGTPSQETLANSVFDAPESRPQSPDAYLHSVATPRVLRKPASLRSPSPSPPARIGHYRPHSQLGFNVGATESHYGFPLMSRWDTHNASQTQLAKPMTNIMHPWPTASTTDVRGRRAEAVMDSSGTDTDSDAPPIKLSGPLTRGASNNSTTNRLTKFLLPKKNSVSSGVATDTSASVTSSPASTPQREGKSKRRQAVRKSTISAPIIASATWEAHDRDHGSVAIAIQAKSAITANRCPTPEVYAPFSGNENEARRLDAVEPTNNTRKGNTHSKTTPDPGAAVVVTPEASSNGTGREGHSSDTDIAAHYLKVGVPVQVVDATPRHRREKTLPVEPAIGSVQAPLPAPARQRSRATTPIPPAAAQPAAPVAPASGQAQPPPPPPKMFKRRTSSVPVPLSTPTASSKAKSPPGTTANGSLSAQTQGLPTTQSISNTSIVNISISTPHPAPPPESLADHTANADAYIAPRPAPRPPGILRSGTEPLKGTDDVDSDIAGGKVARSSESEVERKRSVVVVAPSKQGRTKSKPGVKLPKECTKVEYPGRGEAGSSFPPPPPVPKSPPPTGNRHKMKPDVHSEKSSATTASPSPTEWALPTAAQIADAAAHYVTGEDGKHVSFGSLFRKQRTVVVFIRHFWCPLCQDYMSALTTLVKPEMLLADSEDADWEKIAVEEAMEAKGEKLGEKEQVEGKERERKKQKVDFVIISNGAYGMIAKYKQIFALPFKVYTDPSLAVYKALGMGREGDLLAQQYQHRREHLHQRQPNHRERQHEKQRNKGYQSQSESEKSEKEKRGKRDGYVKHGLMSGFAMVVVRAIKVGMPVWEKGGDVGQLGGEFVMGPGLTCSYAHRMQSTKDHAPIQDVLQAAGVRLPSPSPAPGRRKSGPDGPRAHRTRHHGHSHSEILDSLSTLPQQENERGKESKADCRPRKRRESMRTIRESLARANSAGVTVSPLGRRESRRYSIGVVMTREEEEEWMEERQRHVERLQERKQVRRVLGAPGLSRASSVLANHSGSGADGGGLGGAGVLREDDLDQKEREVQVDKTMKLLEAAGAKIERVKEHEERENAGDLPRLPLVEEDR